MSIYPALPYNLKLRKKKTSYVSKNNLAPVTGIEEEFVKYIASKCYTDK